jgi:hypothetical protein
LALVDEVVEGVPPGFDSCSDIQGAGGGVEPPDSRGNHELALVTRLEKPSTWILSDGFTERTQIR